MSGVITALRGNEAEMSSKLRQLKVWLSAKELSEQQQARIMDYFHSTWMTNRQIDYGDLVAQMPPAMASEVVTKLCDSNQPLYTR